MDSQHQRFRHFYTAFLSPQLLHLHLKIKPTEKLSIDQIIGVDTYNQKGNIYIPVYPYENVNPAYYDDGYIAYLNGIEFSRRNLGSPGSAVYHTTTATALHEADLSNIHLMISLNCIRLENF